MKNKFLIIIMILAFVIYAMAGESIKINQESAGNRHFLHIEILDLPDFFPWDDFSCWEIMSANYRMLPPDSPNWVNDHFNKEKRGSFYVPILQPLKGNFWFWIKAWSKDGSLLYDSEQFEKYFGSDTLYKYVIPVMSTGYGFQAAIQIININDEQVNITLIFHDFEKGQISEQRFSLEPFENINSFLPVLIPDTQFSGWVEIKSDKKIIVNGLTGENILNGNYFIFGKEITK